MSWVIRFADDAWDQYKALSGPVKDKLRQVLFSEWVVTGPKADGVRLVNGIIFREVTWTFGVQLYWLVPADNDKEVLVVKIRAI